MPDFDGNIDPAASWAAVPQLSTTAVALGGASGAMNAQAIALTARTKQLEVSLSSKKSLSEDTVTTVASVSGVLTLDLALGKYFKTAIFENITSIVITNGPAAGYGDTFFLWLLQDPVTARTVVFTPATLRPAKGEALVLSTTLGSLSILSGTIGYDNKYDVTLVERG